MKLAHAVEELFDCDVESLRTELDAMPPETWDADAARQAAFAVHRQTRSIRLVWTPNDWRRTEPPRPERHDSAPKGVQDAAYAIARRLEAHFGGKTIKLVLAELRAGGRIMPHFDYGDALTLAHRCHVPIVTNDQVHMIIDGVRHQFEVGKAYEFDNTRMHAVLNKGEAARVHLICDILEDGLVPLTAAGAHGDAKTILSGAL